MGKYKNKKHEDFARDLKEIRIKHGLTLRDISKLIGIDAVTYSNFENGVEEPFELIYGDEETEVLCHQCGTLFKTRPIINLIFPAYICDLCNNKEKK